MVTKRFTEEELKELRNNPAVRMVSEVTIVLDEIAYTSIYSCWQEEGSIGIIQKLEEYGLYEILENTGYTDALQTEFITCYHNRFSGNAENAINAALAASGVFRLSRSSVSWIPEIRKNLIENYPEQTFEEGILKLGLTPEIVGTSRLNSLKQTVRNKIRREAEAEEMIRKAADHQEKEYGDHDAYMYIKHPYVLEVAGKGRIIMKESFFNEMKILQELPIEKLLQIYEIDASLLKRTNISQIQQELMEWKKNGEVQRIVSEHMIRMQINRMNAMQKYAEKLFAGIKADAVKLSPKQKKHLCRELSEYPTSLNHPCGYSLREILKKSGVSKTTYYKALNSRGYGMSEEIRKERDERDLAVVMKVAGYKGFEKGIRQIYMMMPELTGEQFAISKIRRLLRSAGIKTKVRGENPARQRAREFHDRNTKPNILKREFRLHRPNEVRLTDVTYLDYGHTDEGGKKRAYGSSCIDPVTGKLLAFNISENNDVQLAMETLEKLSEHPTMIGALLHSDQGILYLTDEFQAKVAEMGMMQSMSKRGNCWDNAPQESFFGHFKDECHYEECETFEQLQAMIEEYAYYYNHERHQWSRNRMTPKEYEAYMDAMTEEEFEAYMEAERAKYANMKKKAEEKAIERAKTLGV